MRSPYIVLRLAMDYLVGGSRTKEDIPIDSWDDLMMYRQLICCERVMLWFKGLLGLGESCKVFLFGASDSLDDDWSIGRNNGSMLNNVQTGFDGPCVFGLCSWFDALVTYRFIPADVSYWKRNGIWCAMFHSDVRPLSSSVIRPFFALVRMDISWMDWQKENFSRRGERETWDCVTYLCKENASRLSCRSSTILWLFPSSLCLPVSPSNCVFSLWYSISDHKVVVWQLGCLG